MIKKKKITVFVSSLRGGGAERVMLNLASGFATQGHQVDLLLARKEGPYLKHVPDSVRLVILPQHSRLRGLSAILNKRPLLFFKLLSFHPARMLKLLPGLIDYLLKHEPDTIIAGLHNCSLATLCACFCIKSRVQTIIVEHNTLSKIINSVSSRKKRLLPLINYFYPGADKIVAISDGVKADLIKTANLQPDNIVKIYNPIVTKELLEMARMEADHPWFQRGEPPVIIGVGRLVPQKNFSILIKAFAEVRSRRNVRLMILGEGRLRIELEQLAEQLQVSDDVIMPGFQNNPFACISRASVFVLSSDWEGLVSVLVEALATGCPVISTDCPSGPSEILKRGKYGRLVPAGDYKAMADAILQTLDAPTNREDLIARADDFSIDIIIDQYSQLLGTM